MRSYTKFFTSLDYATHAPPPHANHKVIKVCYPATREENNFVTSTRAHFHLSQ